MSKSTIGTYKKTVWKSCSAYVKVRDCDEDGLVKCCTCRTILSIYDSNCHAGHFVNSRCNSVLFDDAIIHPQCDKCNMFNHGQQARYGFFLKKKYGYDDLILEELLLQKNKIKKFTMTELKEIKANFDKAIKTICNEKGIRSPLEKD